MNEFDLFAFLEQMAKRHSAAIHDQHIRKQAFQLLYMINRLGTLPEPKDIVLTEERERFIEAHKHGIDYRPYLQHHICLKIHIQ